MFGNASTDFSDEIEEALDQVISGLRSLAKNQLVVCSQGNVSIFLPKLGLIWVKASGAWAEGADEDDFVAMKLDGTHASEDPHERRKKPSTDFESHRYIYERLGGQGVTAIVHTHSTFATARAAGAWGIPCVLTSMADEFGGSIPCLPYTTIGGTAIGEGVVKYWKDSCACGQVPSKAMLLAQHGVIAVGDGVLEAVKAAIMCEDCARTAHFAKDYAPSILPESEIVGAYARYQNDYGQKEE